MLCISVAITMHTENIITFIQDKSAKKSAQNAKKTKQNAYEDRCIAIIIGNIDINIKPTT